MGRRATAIHLFVHTGLHCPKGMPQNYLGQPSTRLGQRLVLTFLRHRGLQMAGFFCVLNTIKQAGSIGNLARFPGVYRNEL